MSFHRILITGWKGLCNIKHNKYSSQLGRVQDLLESSYDIRTIQELLGHKDVTTTMVYRQVLKKGGRAVKSPVDG